MSEVYRVWYSWGGGVCDSGMQRPDGSVLETRHEWRLVQQADGSYAMQLVPITIDTRALVTRGEERGYE
jgi:hypothetical protein